MYCQCIAGAIIGALLGHYWGIAGAIIASDPVCFHESVKIIEMRVTDIAGAGCQTIYCRGASLSIAGAIPMPITHHAIDLVFRARKLIEQVSVIKAAELCDAGAARLIDLRDVQELKDAGTIPTAYHATRGMLEFWADPQSPYHKYVFSTDRKLILFCASGMRSALATKTLKDMGMTNVIDMEGGFTEWKMQGLPVEYLI